MHQVYKFGCIFLLYSIFIVKVAGQDASILLDDPFVENNITHVYKPGGLHDANTEKTTKEGLNCLYIPETQYAYFRVNDPVVTPSDNNLIVSVTFFDEGTNSILLQYNATFRTTPTISDNYKNLVIPKTNTNTWITATVVLTDASFRKAQNNQADFRLTSPNYIREITITKGVLNPDNESTVPVAASSYSEFTGKTVAGFQGWFKTGNATTGWSHWSGGSLPKANNVSFEIYPDVTEYNDADLTETGFANLGNGQAAKLFTSYNTDVINTHFKWMKDYGIDGAAVQRFIGTISASIVSSDQNPIRKLKRAAEENKRIFYLCYDISGGNDNTWVDLIKFDWVYNVERNNDIIQSPAYAKVGNKPVVQLWGPGFTDRPGTAEQTIALVNFLKSRNCYVIGGLPTNWRTEGAGSKPNFLTAYKSFDMVSPWMVGRFIDNSGSDAIYNAVTRPDKIYCDQNGIDYMPVIFPGFAWSQWQPNVPNQIPRNAGEFFWHQAVNIKNTGVNNVYIAMFDEYDEGTAIMKIATDWTMIPTDQYFLTASADGYWLSSDFYLRTAGAATEMFKGERPVTPNVPVPHSEGPVYYRNSFESMTTPYWYQNKVALYTGTFAVDPCFKNPGPYISENPGIPQCEINREMPHTGSYSVKFSGIVYQSGKSMYYYKISETVIPVKQDMEISFWKNTVNEAGRYAFVDIITKSGKNLRDYGYKTTGGENMHPNTGHGTVGAGWEQFTCKLGQGVLLGDTITSILIAYENTGIADYTAYFDDFLIRTDNNDTHVEFINKPVASGVVYAENGRIYSTYPSGTAFHIYNPAGLAIRNDSRLPAGIYFVKAIVNGKGNTHKIVVK